MSGLIATARGRHGPAVVRADRLRQGGRARPGALIAAAAALLAIVAAALLAARHAAAPQFGPPIAQLARKQGVATVAVQLAADGTALALHATPEVSAVSGQAYQLWLMPETGAAQSLAVMTSLDGVVPIRAAQRGQLRMGAALAITVEPPGGAPGGQPGGELIVAGPIIELPGGP